MGISAATVTDGAVHWFICGYSSSSIPSSSHCSLPRYVPQSPFCAVHNQCFERYASCFSGCDGYCDCGLQCLHDGQHARCFWLQWESSRLLVYWNIIFASLASFLGYYVSLARQQTYRTASVSRGQQVNIVEYEDLLNQLPVGLLGQVNEVGTSNEYAKTVNRLNGSSSSTLPKKPF